MSVDTHACEYAFMQAHVDPEADTRCPLHLVFSEGLPMYLSLPASTSPRLGLQVHAAMPW